MPNIAYVQGKWVPLSSAKISVEDRGFQFGDGVYELIRTYQNRIFHLEDHLQRLYRSAQVIGIVPRETPSQIRRIVQTGCNKTGYPNVKIYIQMTRGTAPRAHPFPKGVKATTVCTFRRFDALSPILRKEGVSVMTTEDIRWSRCDVKSLNLLPNILARQQAIQSHAFEAVFVREGYVWEGAGSNIFGVFGKTVATPPIGRFVLAGVTRDQVLKLGQKANIEVCEKKIRLSDLYRADEVFLTGTTFEVLPVVCVNYRMIGQGCPGPITALLYQAFCKSVQE